jgi:hypothetical protein
VHGEIPGDGVIDGRQRVGAEEDWAAVVMTANAAKVAAAFSSSLRSKAALNSRNSSAVAGLRRWRSPRKLSSPCI